MQESISPARHATLIHRTPSTSNRPSGRARALLWSAVLACSLVAQGCGNGGPAQGGKASLADATIIIPEGTATGVTPFIAFVKVRGDNLDRLDSIGFQIAPMPDTVSRPVSVRYEVDYLRRSNYFVAGDTATVPVFGLYANYTNRVELIFTFKDQSERRVSLNIATGSFTDPYGTFDRPTRRVPRQKGSELGFDFFAMKSALAGPVVVDTDGYIRWAVQGPLDAIASRYVDDGFLVAAPTTRTLRRLDLDGTSTEGLLLSPDFAGAHHEIEQGKSGLLVSVYDRVNGVALDTGKVAEITPAGAILRTWDIAGIVGSYMARNGDNPAEFVRTGADWLHANSAIYDSRDNSLTVSSRENFLLNLDYDSGEIRWILGDPTKYWHKFASLRAKALTLEGGGLYPVGQHSPSITSDGLLMVFNNGAESFNQPAGEPAGESHKFSAVSAYAIDAANHTAKQAWQFDYQQSIFSRICSSAYESAGKSLLVSYAVAEQGTRTRLVGLNPAHEVVFDFEYKNPSPNCPVSWNAVPVPFDALTFK
jgi:arylsulfate sulfotransferase